MPPDDEHSAASSDDTGKGIPPPRDAEPGTTGSPDVQESESGSETPITPGDIERAVKSDSTAPPPPAEVMRLVPARIWGRKHREAYARILMRQDPHTIAAAIGANLDYVKNIERMMRNLGVIDVEGNPAILPDVGSTPAPVGKLTDETPYILPPTGSGPGHPKVMMPVDEVVARMGKLMGKNVPKHALAGAVVQSEAEKDAIVGAAMAGAGMLGGQGGSSFFTPEDLSFFREVMREQMKWKILGRMLGGGDGIGMMPNGEQAAERGGSLTAAVLTGQQNLVNTLLGQMNQGNSKIIEVLLTRRDEGKGNGAQDALISLQKVYTDAMIKLVEAQQKQAPQEQTAKIFELMNANFQDWQKHYQTEIGELKAAGNFDPIEATTTFITKLKDTGLITTSEELAARRLDLQEKEAGWTHEEKMLRTKADLDEKKFNGIMKGIFSNFRQPLTQAVKEILVAATDKVKGG